MTYKITFSPLPKITYQKNIHYLDNNWPLKSKVKFITNISKTVFLIKDNPEFFPKWKTNNNIRKAVIVKQITMFYKIEKDTIEILLFWNSYQNPDKLKELIKR